MSAPDRNAFTIVIPTFNRASYLEKALHSVQRLVVPPGWTCEVLVIDNNCTDRTPQVVEEAARAGAIPIRSIPEHRQGLNHARNRGLEAAANEHVVFLDDDMEVDSGWLEGYVELHDLYRPDCVTGPVYPIFETPPPEWWPRQVLDSVTSAYSLKGDQPMLVPAMSAHELPGCNFAVLRAVAREIGGFEPTLDRSGGSMLAGGDWEFGERMVKYGKRVAYSPRCAVHHVVSRDKLHRDGIRRRWHGLGATEQARMALRGVKLSMPRRARLWLRMMRYKGWSIRSRWVGKRGPAFQWELEALRLKGLLYGLPTQMRDSIRAGARWPITPGGDHRGDSG